MGFTGEFVIIGHRGAAGLAPENTLAGFQLASNLGVDAVELDVQLVDGRLAVFHDACLKRILGIDRRLDSFSWQALRQLDVGQGERVPELPEVFDLLPERIGINIELKGSGTGAICADVLNLRRPNHSVLVSSFFERELESFQAGFDVQAGEVRTGLLLNKPRSDMLAIAHGLGAWSIHIDDRMALPELIDTISSNSIQVFVYKVNTESRSRELQGMGVQGVFTDFPDLVRRGTTD